MVQNYLIVVNRYQPGMLSSCSYVWADYMYFTAFVKNAAVSTQ